MNTKAGFRKGLLAAGAAGVLAACGGGELFLIAVVTPLNGAWRLDGDSNQEGLQITSPSIDVQLFSSAYDVRATMLNPADLCGGQDNGSGLPLTGRYDNGRIVLRAEGVNNAPVCVDATVASLIRMNAAASGSRPARFYQNSRVDVNLNVGLWANEAGTVRLKFSEFQRPGGGDPGSIDNDELDVPVTACDYSPGVTVPVLAGEMDGFIRSAGAKPSIPSLTVVNGTEVRFTNVEFTDGATITLRNAAGQTVTLKRQRETTPLACP